jgi:hypothetical protein
MAPLMHLRVRKSSSSSPINTRNPAILSGRPSPNQQVQLTHIEAGLMIVLPAQLQKAESVLIGSHAAPYESLLGGRVIA